MPTTAARFQVNDVPHRQAAAIRRKAGLLGLSPEDYLKQLIADDLALDLKAKSTSLDDLAAPFRKALNGVSDSEIDHIVDKARKPARNSRRRR